MLTVLFLLLMIIVFGKILKFAIKMTWSISKIVCTVVLLPLILLGLVLKGLVAVAFPILVVIGLISLFKLHD